MALDHRRRALERDRFDDVGIERALAEEARAADGRGVLFEDVDEGVADDAALLFGIDDAGEALEEEIGGLGDAQGDAEAGGESRLDAIAFARAQQAVIDKDAAQAIADR